MQRLRDNTAHLPAREGIDERATSNFVPLYWGLPRTQTLCSTIVRVWPFKKAAGM